MSEIASKLAEVVAENERLRKDAERWDWVRQNPRTFWMRVLCQQPPSWSPSDNIDACIDAAIAAEGDRRE